MRGLAFAGGLALLLASPLTGWAQVDEDLVFIADEAYKLGDKRDARAQYIMATGINPNNVRAQYMSGIAYLETIHKEKALPFLLRAYELDPAVAKDILYSIAQAYHLGKNFDKAAEYYTRYKETVLGKVGDGYTATEAEKVGEQVDRRLAECETGKRLVANPVPFKIESIGMGINTEYPEYAPAINADENMLVFTARRSGGVSPDKANDNMFYEDIYLSRKTGDTWGAAQNLADINTPNHEASIALSADGQMMLLYKDDNGGDLYYSEFKTKKGVWSEPEYLEGTVNSDFAERSASISPDGNLLFFASDRPGGLGGLDIYVSEALSGGKWGAPMNLGPSINTPYDDDSPVLGYDGKTIYFASEGHEGMGGYDIFKAVFDSTQMAWSTPENIGYPINTPDDDTYYAIAADGERAYYASVNDAVGPGDMDIFVITPLPPEQAPAEEVIAEVDTTEQEPTEEVVAKADTAAPPVLLADSSPEPVARPTLSPVRVVAEVVDPQGRPVAARAFWRRPDGTQVALRPDGAQLVTEIAASGTREGTLVVSQPGYLNFTLNVTLPDPTPESQTVAHTIELTPVATGRRQVLRNVYFDFNEATLQADSYDELNRLRDFLRQNPTVRVEIAGHTDKVGNAAFNKQLSQRRAEAVVSYLKKEGVSAGQLRAVGYGEERPLASNDDEREGRELNRRTEFEVLD